jgi:hypothetical protein
LTGVSHVGSTFDCTTVPSVSFPRFVGQVRGW